MATVAAERPAVINQLKQIVGNDHVLTDYES